MRLLTRLIALSVIALAMGIPSPSSAQVSLTLIPGIPLLRQQHSLTCESAAVSMATRAQIAEGQLMAALPRSANPNLGFRGSPDGRQGTKLVDYGVYAAPLQAALLRFGYASQVLNFAYDASIKSFINRGWPVVAWVTYALQKATPRLVQHNGVQFFLVPHEHAITIVGYDQNTLLANDPWTGKQVRYYWQDFNRSWGYFGDMALAVEPCQTAQPVARIDVSALGTDAVTWTWAKPQGAVHFGLTVTRYGAKSTVVFAGTQDTTQFTLNNPSPGKLYEIDVRSISACGDAAAPTTVWARIPDASPTPVEGTVPPATPTVTTTSAVATATRSAASATPAVTSTPTATPTPTAKP
jgi:uncharacterized protein YvpB